MLGSRTVQWKQILGNTRSACVKNTISTRCSFRCEQQILNLLFFPFFAGCIESWKTQDNCEMDWYNSSSRTFYSLVEGSFCLSYDLSVACSSLFFFPGPSSARTLTSSPHGHGEETSGDGVSDQGHGKSSPEASCQGYCLTRYMVSWISWPVFPNIWLHSCTGFFIFYYYICQVPIVRPLTDVFELRRLPHVPEAVERCEECSHAKLLDWDCGHDSRGRVWQCLRMGTV